MQGTVLNSKLIKLKVIDRLKLFYFIIKIILILIPAKWHLQQLQQGIQYSKRVILVPELQEIHLPKLK